MRSMLLKAEDDEGNPLPPKLAIYSQKPENDADKDHSGVKFGHTFLGIEYSRFSRRTNRYERYDLRFGFFENGPVISTDGLGHSANVNVPGQLRNDHDVQFNVGRKYTVTAKQVNDVLKAAETYADKGYNAVNRNCTTFVKEMVRDHAHLPIANDIFKEDTHIRITTGGNLGYILNVAGYTNMKMGTQSHFEKMGQQEDLSYSGYGNKRYTKEEYRRYKDSLEGGMQQITTADIPNAAGENMRRLEGKYAGELTAGSYMAEKKEYEKLKRIDKLADYFDKSHRYMTEKSSYSQEDVDYAFSLSKKERGTTGQVRGSLLDKGSGSIYKALILEKVFGGMKQSYLAHIKPEQAQDVGAIQEWLEEELNKAVSKKSEDFTVILRSMTRTADDKNLEQLKNQFAQLMVNNWFSNVFPKSKDDGPLSNGPSVIADALRNILSDDQSRFQNTLTTLLKGILAEEEIAKPDDLQKVKGNK